MQNKLTSLAIILLATVALTGTEVLAQNQPATAATAPKTVQTATSKTKTAATDSAVKPIVKVENKQAQPAVKPTTKPVTTKPATKAAVKAENKQAQSAAKSATKPVENKPVAKSDTKPVTGLASNKPLANANSKPTQVASAKSITTIDAVQAENKRRLEEELKNTTISGKSIVDFPNRSSLGTLEMAPLPGINDSAIRGPLPMAASVSGKDLPSEQLLGRITPEVFQEMADLERGNTFLKLQLEKEKLKNDLEKLKATYRQQRLDEIAKREDVVRSRIQWWQEQEKLRLAIAKKQAEEEALARKIAEQEATREKVREETMKRLAAVQKQPVAAGKDKKEKKALEKPIILPQETMEELYTLDSIRGINGRLSARIKSKKDGSILTVKRDDVLPSGHVVKEVKKDHLTVAFGKRIDQLVFRPAEK